MTRDERLGVREIRQNGLLAWLAKRIEHIESDLAFLRHTKEVQKNKGKGGAR